MRSFTALLHKEALECVRTFKLFIMAAIFLFFGMLGPIITRILPDLLASLSVGTDVIPITLPDPSAIMAWEQFFSNIGQMGSLALLIMFCGIMAGELSKGTLIIILTKGLKRYKVILAKFLVAVALWTAMYLLGLGVSYACTAFFWPMDGMHHVFLSFFSLWLFGVFLISMTVLGGVLLKKVIGTLLVVFGIMTVMSIVNIFPQTFRYNPINLGGANFALLAGLMDSSDFIPSMVVCFALIVAMLVASIIIFDREQI